MVAGRVQVFSYKSDACDDKLKAKLQQRILDAIFKHSESSSSWISVLIQSNVCFLQRNYHQQRLEIALKESGQGMKLEDWRSKLPLMSEEKLESLQAL